MNPTAWENLTNIPLSLLIIRLNSGPMSERHSAKEPTTIQEFELIIMALMKPVGSVFMVRF